MLAVDGWIDGWDLLVDTYEASRRTMVFCVVVTKQWCWCWVVGGGGVMDVGGEVMVKKRKGSLVSGAS
jgi:hypothetical protein